VAISADERESRRRKRIVTAVRNLETLPARTRAKLLRAMRRDEKEERARLEVLWSDPDFPSKSAMLRERFHKALDRHSRALLVSRGLLAASCEATPRLLDVLITTGLAPHATIRRNLGRPSVSYPASTKFYLRSFLNSLRGVGKKMGDPLPVSLCAAIYRAAFDVGTESYLRLRQADKKRKWQAPPWFREVRLEHDLELGRLLRDICTDR
jgi:hypothetical protein